MKLHKKQKKYIDKNIGIKSLNQISQKLKVREFDVENYLNSKKQNQTQTFEIHDEGVLSKLSSFSFSTFLSQNKKQILILLSLAFLAFVNAFNNEFLSDDIDGIVLNQKLEKFNYFFEGFPPNLQKLLYFLIFSVFGRNPFFFRIINNFIPHLLCIVAVYALVYLLEKKRIAFITAAIFAIHPVLVESVVWISAGSYPRYSLFIILALIFFILSEKQKKYFWWSMGALLTALSFSEKAIMFPLLLISFIYVFGIGKQNIKKLVYLAIPAVAFGILLMSRISDRFLVIGQESEMLNPLKQIPIAISSYLELILWPDKLTLYHSEMFFSTFQYILMLIVFLSYISLTIYFLVKKKKIGFWLSFLLITLSPTLTPFGISWIVAERYVYLGCLGVFVIMAYFFDYIRTKNETAFYFLFSLVLVSLMGRTVIRNTDWKNMDRLWIAAERTSPNSHQNSNNLGDMYGRWKDYDKAIYYFKKSVDIKSDYGEGYHNLANIYREMGKVDLALENYKNAVRVNPNIWQSWQNIASIYLQNKDYGNAIKTIDETLKFFPNNTSINFAAGVIYMESGDLVKAKIYFQKSLELDPNNQLAKEGLNRIELVN